MSQAQALPASPLKQLWLKWRFHLNILLILIPLGFMPKYFADARLFRGDAGLGANVISDIQVGPYSLDLAELRDEAPHADGPAGYFKSFNASLCKACIKKTSRQPTCASANQEACAPPAPFSSVHLTTWAPRCRFRRVPNPTRTSGSPWKAGTAACTRRRSPWPRHRQPLWHG